ncbi:MAG: ZIP family metal transporter, partial [Candidatus Aenigmatarchaeota archaeon]
MVWETVLLYSFGGGIASFIAAILLLWKLKWSHDSELMMVSFAIGVLLAASAFDLLPEAMLGIGAVPTVMYTVLGLGTFWFAERIVMRHHRHTHSDKERAKVTATLVLFGDSIHNFVDGVVIAATFLAGAALGGITALAVFLHEIPQELSDVSILRRGGWSRKNIIIYNGLSALTAVAGAVIMMLAAKSFDLITTPMLAFTAGGFLYIAAFSLLPTIFREAKSHRLAT